MQPFRFFDIIPGMDESRTWKTPGEIADEWGISDRRVRILCAEGRINPTRFDGKHWLISPNAVRPRDGRITRYSGNSSTDESIAVDIIRKKQTVVRNLRRMLLTHLIHKVGIAHESNQKLATSDYDSS